MLYDSWTALFIKDSEVDRAPDSGSLFRDYACSILATNEIGITDYKPDMFLFWDDWKPEDIYGPDFLEKTEEARSKQFREDPGFFDDDIDILCAVGRPHIASCSVHTSYHRVNAVNRVQFDRHTPPQMLRYHGSSRYRNSKA